MGNIRADRHASAYRLYAHSSAAAKQVEKTAACDVKLYDVEYALFDLDTLPSGLYVAKRKEFGIVTVDFIAVSRIQSVLAIKFRHILFICNILRISVTSK